MECDPNMGMVWSTFTRRIAAGGGALSECSLADALFVAGSVAHLLAPGNQAQACRVQERLWRQAACAILDAQGCAGPPGLALARLGEALDHAPMDAAYCTMMDGIEALERGDWAEAAALGESAPVRDGKSQDLVRWLEQRGSGHPSLRDAGTIMHLVAWALFEAGLSWAGTRAELLALERDVRRSCDVLLFRAPCYEVLQKLCCDEDEITAAVGRTGGSGLR